MSKLTTYFNLVLVFKIVGFIPQVFSWGGFKLDHQYK